MDNKTLPNRSVKQLFTRLLVSEYFILVLSVVYFLVISIFRPKMMNPANIYNIFYNMCPLLAVCLGQTFVLLLGGIDLSQTAVISFCSTAAGILLGSKFEAIKFGTTPIWGKLISENGGMLSRMPEAAGTILTVVLVLAMGALIGAVNGLLISKMNMPPFMVTLISEMLWSAIALWLVSSSNCTGLNASFCELGKGKIGGAFPVSAVIVLVLLVGCEFLLSKTLLGKWVYSVGANPRAARVSGIPKNKIIVIAYTLSGFFAAVGSILYTGRQQMGRPTLGDGMLNDVLGATVIGGVSMYGGKGKAVWALFGTFFYCIMTTSMNMLRLNSFVVQVVKGCIILFAVSLDVVRIRLQKKITK